MAGVNRLALRRVVPVNLFCHITAVVRAGLSPREGRSEVSVEGGIRILIKRCAHSPAVRAMPARVLATSSFRKSSTSSCRSVRARRGTCYSACLLKPRVVASAEDCRWRVEAPVRKSSLLAPQRLAVGSSPGRCWCSLVVGAGGPSTAGGGPLARNLQLRASGSGRAAPPPKKKG